MPRSDVRRAIEFVDKAFAEDREGFTHSMSVALLVGYHSLEGEIIVALLHDVVEDTSITIEDIEKEFGRRVAKSVGVLTRKPEETYMEYIDRIIESHDMVAMCVKFADLEDHLLKKDTLSPTLESRYMKALKKLLLAK